jgi:hypothetical protein
MKPLRAEIQIIKARCLDTLQSNEPRIANGGMTSREKVLWCWLVLLLLLVVVAVC